MRLPARAKAVSAGLLLVLVLVASALQLGPEIGRPLALERGLDEEPAHQYLEQRVGNIAGEKPVPFPGGKCPAGGTDCRRERTGVCLAARGLWL